MAGALVVAGLMIACGSKKKDEPAQAPPPPSAPLIDAAPPPPVGPSAPLWQLAPDDAVAGLVIPANGAGKLAAAWAVVRTEAASDPFWAAQVDLAQGWLGPMLADPAAPVTRFFAADGRPITDVQPGAAAPLASPSPLSGDLEMRVDPTRVRGFESVIERLEERFLRGSTAWAAALSVDGARLEVDLELTGAPLEPWDQLLDAPAANREIEARRADSSLALGMRLHRSAMERWASSAGIDAAHVAAFTGDVGVFVRGAGPPAIELVLGVVSADAATAAVGPLCNTLLRPFGPIEGLSAGVCRVRLAAAPDAAGGLLGRALLAELAGRQAVARVVGDALVVSLGEAPDPAPVAGLAPAPAWQLWLETRGFDPLALMPGLDSAVADPVATSLRWLAARVERGRIGLNISSTGVRVGLELDARAGQAGRSP